MGRTAAIIIALVSSILLAAPALACSDCSSPQDTARCCSKRIFEISKILKHHMQCEFPDHRCAFPLDWDRTICLDPVCHENPQYCDIDREICLEPPCHMPALALRPVECCLCGIELTGTKDLIVICDACRSHD
ncbi:MAG: hypothetical protein H7A35_08010 [Planctomycetales bacterium]|nr:hypothetical protein [bacterium]UNM09998.1 MAG: hypothetical protein H7A35_08010 [Planctomycetales bacterium]